MFSVLNSHTRVKSAEWSFSIRLTCEPWRAWKSHLSSGNSFPDIGDKTSPRTATRTSSSHSLTDPELCDKHTHTEHSCPCSCTAASRHGGGFTSSIPPRQKKTSRTELAMAPQPFGDTKDLLVLVVALSHLSLLLYCCYMNWTSELPLLPSSAWSCRPCSFPPMFSFTSLYI